MESNNICNMKEYMKVLSKSLMLLFLAAVFVLPANAAPQAVGPVDPADGFPQWFGDTNGLLLEKCLDTADAPTITCLFDPAIDLPNPAAPLAFPGNYPPEIFWWTADTDIISGDPNAVVNPTGIDALLVLAMEGAFGGELAVD